MTDAQDIGAGERWHPVSSVPDVRPVMELDVAVSCSAGTHIRALGRDLGEALGLGGYLTMLRRIRIGDFTETMPNIENLHQSGRRGSHT